MNANQPWYLSRGIWGSAIGVLVGLASVIFHTSVSPTDQTMLINDGLALGSIVAGLVAFWGRLKATKTISKGTN